MQYSTKGMLVVVAGVAILLQWLVLVGVGKVGSAGFLLWVCGILVIAAIVGWRVASAARQIVLTVYCLVLWSYLAVWLTAFVTPFLFPASTVMPHWEDGLNRGIVLAACAIFSPAALLAGLGLYREGRVSYYDRFDSDVEEY